MKKCPSCGKLYTDNDYYCLRDNYRLISCSEEESYYKPNNQSQSYSPEPNVPKCPTCGSTNIKRISSLSRATHGFAFGLLSKTARSQFECKNCRYKW